MFRTVVTGSYHGQTNRTVEGYTTPVFLIKAVTVFGVILFRYQVHTTDIYTRVPPCFADLDAE